MEFKGTQGELTLHEKPYANTNGFYVQSVSSEFDNNMLFSNAYGHTKEEAEANAKLISCVPEMLALLGDIQCALTMQADANFQKLINDIHDLRVKATTI